VRQPFISSFTLFPVFFAVPFLFGFLERLFAICLLHVVSDRGRIQFGYGTPRGPPMMRPPPSLSTEHQGFTRFKGNSFQTSCLSPDISSVFDRLFGDLLRGNLARNSISPRLSIVPFGFFFAVATRAVTPPLLLIFLFSEVDQVKLPVSLLSRSKANGTVHACGLFRHINGKEVPLS